MLDGENASSIGLDGQEAFDVIGINEGRADHVNIIATKTDGTKTSFKALVRIDTPKEQAYFINGGILQYVLRQLVKADKAA